MYKCQITGLQSKPNQKLNKVIAVTRDMIYKKWVKDEETIKWQEIEAGRGFEPVKELNLSQEGLDLWNSWSPAEKAQFLKGM